MDASTSSQAFLADILDLDRVAVGPYCVYDPFLPSPESESPNRSSKSELSLFPTVKPDMDDPSLANGFSFGANMRSPWVVSSAEDVSIIGQPPNDLGQEDWNEWMGWDASQGQSPKPLNIQGPLCFLKPESQRSPLLSRRQNAQLNSPSLGQTPATVNAAAAAVAATSTPFTFGGPAENTPAFSFKGTPPINPAATQAAAFPTANAHWDAMQPFDSNGTVSPTNFERQPQVAAAGMPPLNTPSLQHSPSSLTNAHTSPSSTQSSPEPGSAVHGKKRKSLEDGLEEAPLSGAKQPPVKKTAHNMIEKRYRTNLNDKIAALRDSVPSLRVISRSTTSTGENDDDPEDLEGLTPAHKLNKATVLSKATEYIHHLEKRVKRLQEELAECKTRLETYNKLAISGPMRLPNAMPTPDGLPYQPDPFASVQMQGPPVTQGPPQGLIPVPESLASLHRAAQNQQHYAYSQAGAQPPPGYPVPAGPPRQNTAPPQQHVNGRRISSNGMMGKLMVGSLAGLMIMEGLSEREKSGKEPNGRGLFALPLTPFRFLSHSSHTLHAAHHPISLEQALFAFARSVLLLLAVLYLVLPMLYLPRGSKKKKSTAANIRLAPAPSLASPVEVRRKAWLTAIQTVWVPQHNFFLEAAALGLKTLKLSTRKLIGWHGYALLTGTTREQEAARVKAWEIALDAQLAGGDAEISNNRLLLTLMASGTLPDNPARLMLKALHVRILLWGYAKAGYGTWYMFEELSAKLARRYWNKAREEHKIAMNRKDVPSEDRLPPHLAALVELDCDKVLVHSIIQRAYNVAWNSPHVDTTPADDTLDSVVEDFAIASPLDALAAWWSSTVLSQALVSFLSSSKPSLSDANKSGLDLAYDTAPPASGAQMRAMTARAVLLDEGRAENLSAAVKALPGQTHTQFLTALADSSDRLPLVNIERNTPAASDMKRSLTISKCLHLAQEASEKGSREARARATAMVNYSQLPGYNLTLLSLAASYKLLLEFSQHDNLLSDTHLGLERFANSVRVWVGREPGRRSGISSKARGVIVEKCLSVSKKLVGMLDDEEVDAGYVSGSDGKKELLQL